MVKIEMRDCAFSSFPIVVQIISRSIDSLTDSISILMKELKPNKRILLSGIFAAAVTVAARLVQFEGSWWRCSRSTSPIRDGGSRVR